MPHKFFNVKIEELAPEIRKALTDPFMMNNYPNIRKYVYRILMLLDEE